MRRLLSVGVMIAVAACGSVHQPIGVLDTAPIHSEVADLMPPGRLAMLQIATITEYPWSMEARASAAVALWDNWADAIDECSRARGGDDAAPRFESPALDDVIWDLMREPDHEFRPYGEEWNAEHGFSSRAPRTFWDSDQMAFLEMDSLAFLGSDCDRASYPYDVLIEQPDQNTSYGSFLDSLALTLLERLEQPKWTDVGTARINELRGQLDLADCLLDGGVPQWVLDSDHYELFAGADDDLVLDEAARYSVVEARCFDGLLTPVDDELYEIANDFANENHEQLEQALGVAERVDEWIEQLPDR